MDAHTSDFLGRLRTSGVAHASQIVGCSEEEIRHVESAAGLRLPVEYKKFLSVMGRRAGLLLDDVFIYYDAMIGLNQIAEKILFASVGEHLRLPEHSFVFSMRSGEQFMFFIADESSEDPAIISYLEGDQQFTQVADWFFPVLRG